MNKIKIGITGAVMIASAVSAYQYGKNNAVPIVREVIKTENVYIKDTQGKIDAENKLNSVLGLLKGEQKIFAKMMTDMNVIVDNPTQAHEDIRFLALAMHRECGICNDAEAVFLGYSIYNFWREKLAENPNITIKKVTEEKWRAIDKNGKPFYRYFLSFMANPRLHNFEPSENDVIIKKYAGYAISILHNVNTAEVNTSAVRENYYAITGGKNIGINWCNTETADCPWHKSLAKNNGTIPFRLNYSQTLSPIINQNQESMHKFFLRKV